jgi:uncharacterized protein
MHRVSCRPSSAIRPLVFCAATFVLVSCASPQAAPHPQAMPVRPEPVTVAVTVPSAGQGMRGTMYVADGEGPRATVLMLHGFPGGPGWNWMAGPLREAGFNVLFLHPRGMWGSEGEFTLANALVDAVNALEFLSSERARSEFRVDTARFILVGHSFGGWLALNAAAGQPQVRCVAALTPANLGTYGERWRTDAAYRSAWTASLRRAVEGAEAPVRTSHGAEEFVAYLVDSADAHDVRHVLGSLRDRPVLLVGARDDRQTPVTEHHIPLRDAFQGAGAPRLTEVMLPTDHSFTARRDLLSSTLVGWLRHECSMPPGSPS